MALTRLRISLITIMGLVIALLAGHVFDSFEPVLLIAPALPGIAAITTISLRRSILTGAALISVPLAVLACVIADGGSLDDATVGILDGPRKLLTTEWPSPVEPASIGSVALLLAVMTAGAVWLAGRPRAHLSPLAVIVAGLTATIALAAPHRPTPWALVLLGLLAVLFTLARPGEPVRQRGRTLTGERTLAVSAIAIAASAILVSGTIAWANRSDPRRTEQATQTAALVDALEATVALRQIDPPVDLFLITDRSILISPSLPTRWRLAALDAYDGQRWLPRLTLRPIGQRLGIADPSGPDTAPPIRFTVELLADDLELIPFPGRPLAIDTTVETDLDRSVVRLIELPNVGDSFEVESELAPTATVANSGIVPRQVDEIAGTFTDLAGNLAGDGVVIDQIRQIEATMRDEWQLDSRAPGGGQQLALIERFMTETRRGSSEQFVAAFVLLVRSLGFDARIATGFQVPPGVGENPLTLRSSYAAAWPEVNVDAIGWVAFDPAPSSETTDATEPPPPPEAQSPAAAQPPIVAPADRAEEVTDTTPDTTTETTRWERVRTWIGRGAVVVGLGLLPVAIGIGLILFLKWRRRRRRLRTPNAVDQIRGAWANATDSLVDAGLSIAPSWTNGTIAEVAAPLAPSVPHEIRRLAAMATAMTFGATDDGHRLVNDAVYTAHVIDDAIRTDRTLWHQLRWRLSLRSLRRSTRSPVLSG